MLLRNCRDGLVSARMLDIKMGNVTAVGGWQGKGNMKAFVQCPDCKAIVSIYVFYLFGLSFCHLQPPMSCEEHYRGFEHELSWRRLPLAPQVGKPSGVLRVVFLRRLCGGASIRSTLHGSSLSRRELFRCFSCKAIPLQ